MLLRTVFAICFVFAGFANSALRLLVEIAIVGNWSAFAQFTVKEIALSVTNCSLIESIIIALFDTFLLNNFVGIFASNAFSAV